MTVAQREILGLRGKPSQQRRSTRLDTLVFCLKPASFKRTGRPTTRATKSGKQRLSTAWTWP